jgi:phage gp45-like
VSSWQVAIGSLVETDDADIHQRGTFTGLAGERFTQVMRPQPFGLSSNPPAGSRGLLLFGGPNREIAAALGMEAGAHRPRSLPVGATALYGANGEIVSLVGKTIRIKADTIVLDGVVKLGGDGAAREVAMRDSVDDAGNKAISNLATKVFAL